MTRSVSSTRPVKPSSAAEASSACSGAALKWSISPARWTTRVVPRVVREWTTMTPGAVSAPESCTRRGTSVARAADSIGAVLGVLTSPSTPSTRCRETSHAILSPHVTSIDPRQEEGFHPDEVFRRLPEVHHSAALCAPERNFSGGAGMSTFEKALEPSGPVALVLGGLDRAIAFFMPMLSCSDSRSQVGAVFQSPGRRSTAHAA
ncbi:hypothetical protein ADK91_30205 [Streptomyces sp. XY511]|nr:hypothetical protein ADK91_30205 [Streptomyces sp. XY511]